VQIQAWHDLLMRGTRKHAMHAQRFTLVRVRLLNADGQPAFKRDLWLVVLGARRQELTLLEIQQAYVQRFDLEHFFRFGYNGRQKLDREMAGVKVQYRPCVNDTPPSSRLR
jgi:hypothetical protein